MWAEVMNENMLLLYCVVLEYVLFLCTVLLPPFIKSHSTNIALPRRFPPYIAAHYILQPIHYEEGELYILFMLFVLEISCERSCAVYNCR
jgi:hypothetical protein